jgi:hypothetical protein
MPFPISSSPTREVIRNTPERLAIKEKVADCPGERPTLG